MESLNMNTLASSLPNSANAEKQLMDNFKAAALSITKLYRSSLDTNKRNYAAGYATCLLDVLRFVEAGVSASGDDGDEMTIGRVMDWLEARLEAIKSTEEEAEEDRMKESKVTAQEETVKEEREKRSRKGSGSGTVPANTSPKLHRRSKENLHDPAQSVPLVPSNRPPSSPPVLAQSFTSPSPPPPPSRPVKQKRGLKDLNSSTPISADVVQFPVTIAPSPSLSPFTFSPDVVSIPAVGSKRRHGAMLSEPPASSSIGASSSPTQGTGHNHPHSHTHSHGGNRRKRVRGARERESHHGAATVGNNNVQGPCYSDAMEVEDESGRERKRVARR